MDQKPEFEEEALKAADNRADAITIVVIFCAIVAFAVFYASGWTFDV